MWGDTTCVAHENLRTADGEQATEAALTDPAHGRSPSMRRTGDAETARSCGRIGYYAPSGSSNSTENSVGTGSSSLRGTRRSGQR